MTRIKGYVSREVGKESREIEHKGLDDVAWILS